MQKVSFILAMGLLLAVQPLAAQVKVGGVPGSPHPAALLELESNNKGLLLPRLTMPEMLAVGTDNLAKGLLVYNTDSSRPYIFNGTAWRPIMYSSPVESWQLTGNSGTDAANQFIGTTDSVALNIRTFNRPHITFTPNRLTGLYTSNPTGLLTLESQNRSGDEDDVLIDNYITGAGSGSNPGFIISTRQGTPAAPQNISGNIYLGGFYQAGRVADNDYVLSGMDAYYRGNVNNVFSSDLRFYTAAVNRMYISATGKVGIGTLNPVGGLDVVGTANDSFGDDINNITYSATNEPSFVAYRNRGTSVTPQPVQPGDRLGEFRFDGNIGNAKLPMAKMQGHYLGGTAGPTLRSRLTFAVNGQTTGQMALDSTGYLGLGTETPISGIDIVAFNKPDAADDINIRTYNNAAGPALLLYRARTAGLTAANLQNGDFLGILNFGGEVNGNNTSLSSIIANYTGNGTNALSSLSFRTSGNQGLFLNEKGWLTIGNSSQSAGATADIQGSLRYRLSAPVAATYTLTNTDLVVLVNDTFGPNTINLPSGADFDGHFIVIKNGKSTPIALSAGSSVLLCNGGGSGCSSLGALRVIGLVGQYTGSTINWIQVF
jgi:hypothetical protein